jgi:hypothetical protein
LGRKFIKLLATAALLDECACHLFLQVLKQIDGQCWQWHHIGILCLGVIVLTSKCSNVRKMALEKGLLNFIDHSSKSEDSMDSSWKLRGATAMVLGEIYHQNKADALGLLAYEALRERRKSESNVYVQDQLTTSIPIQKPRRLSFLFKYICIALAETYSESQSRYQYLRKYLRTTERKSSLIKKESINHAKPFVLGALDPKLKSNHIVKIKEFWNEKVEDRWDPSKNALLLQSPFGSSDSLHQMDDGYSPCSNNDVALSTEPYHYNYRKLKAPLEPPAASMEKRNQLKPPKTRPSLLAARIYKTDSESKEADSAKPSNGSINRRKLFNSVRPPPITLQPVVRSKNDTLSKPNIITFPRALPS